MKLFKRKDKELDDNTEKKPKRVNTVNIGRRHKLLIALWVLFFAAFAFAIYKNFTAIDTHTVHEVEVIETEVIDTSGIESFVREFARSFYTWDNTSEILEARKLALANYMTEELVQLNSNVITVEDGITSAVSDFKIWELTQLSDNTYSVKYVIAQSIKRKTVETVTAYVEEPEITEVVDEETGEVSYQETTVQREVSTPKEAQVDNAAESCYVVTVYVDDNGNMVITSNPTISSIAAKSDYAPSSVSGNSNIDSDTASEIKTFLEKFFTLYPTADENELSYYVKNDALKPIGKDYQFVEVAESTYIQDGNTITAYTTVKYYDEQTGVNLLSQFVLGLEKSGNWFIVSSSNVE